MNMKSMTNMDAICKARAKNSNAPVILLYAYRSIIVL